MISPKRIINLRYFFPTRAAMANPSNIIGHIDGANFSLSSLRIIGWALDKKTLNIPPLTMLINDQPTEAYVTPQKRDDVAKATGLPAHNCGFQIDIPLDRLMKETKFSLAVSAKSGDGSHIRLTDRTLIENKKLQLFASPTEALIGEMVVNAATRGSDLFHQRFSGKFFQKDKSIRMFTRAGCICVLGYRILDLNWNNAQEQLEEEVNSLNSLVTAILQELESNDPYAKDVARWITSVRLCRAWCNVRVGDWEKADQDFDAILAYTHHLAQEPGLILTLTHSAFMRAYFATKRGNLQLANIFWNKTLNIIQIALPLIRFGETIYQYDQVTQAMAAAKNAYYSLMKNKADAGAKIHLNHLPSHDIFDLKPMLRPIPQLKELGCLDFERPSQPRVEGINPTSTQAPPSRDEIEGRISGLRNRFDLTGLLKPGGIGIELGVAEGHFSEALLKGSELAFLYSVDMYAGDRGHDIDQYKRALTRLASYRARNSVLKMRFDEALTLFPDGFFDFIYIDGYAHTGEEGGKTLHDWYPKAKSGSVFAGDDYCQNFPLVIKAVDQFVEMRKLKLHVAEFEKGDNPSHNNPSWIIIKP